MADTRRNVSASQARHIRRNLQRWAEVHSQAFPWRRPRPFWQGLVAEVLLQRTRAAQAVPVFNELIRCYPTAERFANASERDIAKLLAPLGLRWRAPLLYRLATEIGRRKGRLPRVRAELEALPGVGSYGATAALRLHGGVRATIIDSNVVRVLARFVGEEFDGETRRKQWVRDLANRLTPEHDFRCFNYALLDLAMLVCVPRSPHCDRCPLAEMCATARARGGVAKIGSPAAVFSPTSRTPRTMRAT